MNSQYAKQIALGFLLFYGMARLVETFWKREKLNGVIKSRYTIYLLVSGYLIVYLVMVLETLVARREFLPWLTLCGAGVVMLSTVGRLSTIRTFGPYHSIHIEIREEHKLIMVAGPYQYVRNPYYLSVILEVIGLSLVGNAIVGTLMAICVYMPVLVLRIILEEKALAEKFNGSFAEYMSRIPQIVPRIF